MSLFKVAITAIVTKHIEVEAETEEQAVELAHSEFTTEPNGAEKYYEEVDHVEKLEGGSK